MASEAPSWADQWGAGGFGAMEEDENATSKDKGDKKKKKKKTASAGGLGKAKAAAVAGAGKVKRGTSMGIKWIKNQCQKKKPSPTE